MKRVAMVFPGQGSQSVGMLHALAEQFPIIHHTFNEATQVLGYDLWEIVQNGPAERLNQTAVTQPVLLTASIALWRLWQQENGRKPLVMAGHSLGEYSALVCAGVLQFKDAITIVAKRGQLMQDAVPENRGAMAAILTLSPEQVTEICAEASQKDIVAPANFNAPGQIVIAGHSSAVARAMQLAKQRGAKLVKQLDVSVPSHCLLMKQAAIRFAEILNNTLWQSPQIPVIQNVDVMSHQTVLEIKEALSRQLWSPVRWNESITKLVTDYQIGAIVECGAGKVLTGLNKRIVELPVYATAEPDQFSEAIQNV
jgi:[acyl-carrier-protein] S-malonyltransferase